MYDLATTKNKADIEKMIRIAQLVVLNPSLKNPQMWFQKWLNDDPQDHASLEFSPNVIVLNITGPGLLPISFYDLPGVINQAPDGKHHTVQLIRQLVKEYVEEPHTLVLLAVSMESDIEVSTTSGLLNGIDGANDRCMGVLTKPDRRPRDGDISKYRGVLENRMFQKGHGYFVTRQPAQSEIHALDYTGARDMEEKFFRSSEWMRDFPAFEDQVGTRNIRSALSNKLRTLILQCLPKVIDMITQKLDEIEKALKSLPEPSQDPVRIVSELAMSFKECIIDKFGDKFRVNHLRQSWNKDKILFRDSVLKIQPTVNPLSKSEIQDYHPVRQESCEDDDDCSIVEGPTPKRLKTDRVFFELDQVRKDLQDRTISSIPGMINPRAVEEMMIKTLHHWESPLNELLASLHFKILAAHEKACDEVLADFKRTAVPRKISEIGRAFILGLMESQKSMNTRALNLERFKPITENGSLTIQKDAELSSLLAKRKQMRLKEMIEAKEQAMGKKLPVDERRKIIENMDPDPYQGELEVLARVKAYYQIAAYRFIDRICQNVEFELFHKLKVGLKDELETELHIGAKDGESAPHVPG
jgi:hypothetical protein